MQVSVTACNTLCQLFCMHVKQFIVSTAMLHAPTYSCPPLATFSVTLQAQSIPISYALIAARHCIHGHRRHLHILTSLDLCRWSQCDSWSPQSQWLLSPYFSSGSSCVQPILVLVPTVLLHHACSAAYSPAGPQRRLADAKVAGDIQMPKYTICMS